MNKGVRTLLNALIIFHYYVIKRHLIINGRVLHRNDTFPNLEITGALALGDMVKADQITSNNLDYKSGLLNAIKRRMVGITSYDR